MCLWFGVWCGSVAVRSVPYLAFCPPNQFCFHSYLIFCKDAASTNSFMPSDTNLRAFINWQRRDAALLKTEAGKVKVEK